MASIKLFIGALAGPLLVAFFLVVAATLVARLPGRRKLVRTLFVASAITAYLGSISVIGGALLVPLENRYPALREDAISASQVTAIVVLGSGYSPQDNRPITSLLDGDGLSRISEGVRLALRFPAARLVVSGGASVPARAPALGYARFARALGIPQERIVVMDQARDTAQESQAIAKRLGNQRFLLVTSASHMPRAMLLMERAGANAIPAPTSFHSSGRLAVEGIDAFIPCGSGVRQTELAVHEYLGLIALSIGLQ
jgi:uncharacterized SAM-binding protein YcdF (DUF218 family)